MVAASLRRVPVIRLLRCCFALAMALACFSTLASADLKIKTRTTVMGHSTESTVYIKGPRERNEMSYGGHGGAVTILQCDQKRMITIAGNQCIVMAMGGGESSCPTMPNMKAMGREPTPPSKGGVVTITRNSTDTGETQEMFGYKAHHIKSSISTESTPDACNQSHTKMETDGWYADVSPGFSCADDSYRGLACTGAGRGCSDRVVMKGSGDATLGYPLKQTITVTSPQGTFTTTTEVVELTNASLDAPMFDMPSGCRVMDMSAMGGASGSTPAADEPSAPKTAAAPPPEQPAALPAPALAPKAAGVVRIGVVKIKDMSGESLPTDSLLLNLLSEFGRQQLEAVPLDAEGPQQAVEAEASAKQCDYFVYTAPTQVKEPGSGGLAPASLPKGTTLDPAKFQALTSVTLYKVGKPVAELKDVMLAADANQFAVDAVTATFAKESDRVAQQITADAHSKPPAKATKAPAKPGTSSGKPN
jgi:hypothetical protein